MIKSKNLLVLFLSLSICSCLQQNDKDTERLRNYLAVMNHPIEHEPHLYIIYSSFFCKGCISNGTVKLDKLIKGKKSTDITVIVPTSEQIQIPFRDKVTVLLDNNEIDHFFPCIANLTLIITQSERIIRMTDIDSDTALINSVYAEFVKLKAANLTNN